MHTIALTDTLRPDREFAGTTIHGKFGITAAKTHGNPILARRKRPPVRAPWTDGVDPLPTPRVLHTGRQIQLKPPFKLRQRGTSILFNWTHRRGQALRTLAAPGPATKASSRLTPVQQSARIWSRARSTHRRVTPTVERPPLMAPGRCVPAVAGTRCVRDDLSQNTRIQRSPSSAATPHHPSFPPARAGRGCVTPLPTTRQGPWIYHPSNADPDRQQHNHQGHGDDHPGAVARRPPGPCLPRASWAPYVP